MRPELFLIVPLAAAPAAYAWWSGRRILRSLEDPALAELVHSRQRRMAQVTVVAVVVPALTGASMGFVILTLLGLLVAQYPVRRAVYGDTWSLVQYVSYCTTSFVGNAGLLLFALIGPTVAARLVRHWIPGTTRASFALALGLGAVCGAIVLLWRRRFTSIWLALHRASPLETDAAHAPVLPRLHAVLDRAADRLSRRPSIHRYGAKGGRIANAIALPSINQPAVAMSDTLLDALDPDETTAIFAHEVAHHEHFNAERLRARQRWLVVIALLVAAMPALLLATGPGSTLLVHAAFIIALIGLIARGSTNKQTQETASDLRALELTNDPDALIRALTKIHVLARVPRRWAQEIERAATHPSLARRIQAIRARAAVESTSLDTPTVIAATAAGSYVVLDGARAYWLDGVPADTPADLASLRERASSYRAMAYAELTELRLVVTQGARALRATDLAGRSWSVDVRDTDVAVIQSALDAVDSRLGASRATPTARSEGVVRILAVALLLVALLGGGTSALAIPALATLLAPTTASLAAMGAMGSAGILLLTTSDSFGLPRDTWAVLLATALGGWAAWIAWTWHRARREPTAPAARTGVRVMFALLAVTALTTLLVGSRTWSSPRDLASDENAIALAITFLGIGAALLVLRAPALRLAGAGTALLAVAALGTATLGERLWPAASEIGWSSGRLALVATVPLPHEMDAVVLSPGGTRYLTHRSVGNGEVDDDDAYTTQFTTGEVAPGAAPYTVTALDAALPSETEMLVLATNGDSLELRLEHARADSTQRLAWRRSIEKLYAPTLRVLDGGARWQVSGMKLVAGGANTLVTLDGTVDAGDVRRTDVAADTLHSQSVFAYRDGSRLVVSFARSQMLPVRGRSPLWAMLTALHGMDITWHVWRRDREGSHLVTTTHGVVHCWAGTEDDVAVCADQGMRGVHVLSIARTGRVVDLGTLSRRYQRASASPQGQLVASSYGDRSLAVIDVARRRGLRLALPETEGGFARDATATSDAVALILSGQGGPRLVVYRLGPLLETAANSAGR